MLTLILFIEEVAFHVICHSVEMQLITKYPPKFPLPRDLLPIPEKFTSFISDCYEELALICEDSLQNDQTLL